MEDIKDMVIKMVSHSYKYPFPIINGKGTFMTSATNTPFPSQTLPNANFIAPPQMMMGAQQFAAAMAAAAAAAGHPWMNMQMMQNPHLARGGMLVNIQLFSMG
jgi:hypothetical protein